MTNRHTVYLIDQNTEAALGPAWVAKREQEAATWRAKADEYGSAFGNDELMRFMRDALERGDSLAQQMVHMDAELHPCTCVLPEQSCRTCRKAAANTDEIPF